MNFLRWLIHIIIKIGLSVLLRMDADEMRKVPARGPMIVISNHTGQVEVPVMFAWLWPRPVTGWAKVETWDIPFFHWLFNVWGAVPVRRGEADTSALRAALEKLNEGCIFGIAPEGTRNHNGKLLRAYPGAVILAVRSNAPILPLAHWGGENFTPNFKRLRRTDFHIRVGRPFTLQTNGERISKEERQQVVDEMMYQVAALLPEEYRGEYSDMSKATTKFLKFDQPVTASREAAKQSPVQNEEIASSGRSPSSQ